MIRGRKARTLCFRKTSFVHSRSGSYYALLPGYSGLKFLPDVRHCVYWVLAEIWAPDSSHKMCNKFFIHHCQGWKEGSFVCETVWFFSWVNTHPFDLKLFAFCPKFSGDSYVEFQEKTIPGEFFRYFGQTKAILYQNSWNFALLSEILVWVRIALNKFTQVLSYVVCTQVRRHVHKKITKRRYGGEKPGRSVFGKPVLFTLGLGLPTPYSPGILVWNFYQTVVIVSTEFWLRFELQIRPTRCAINFLFITARAERKVLCVWNCLILFLGEYSSVWPEICRVLSQIQWKFLRGISGKNHFGRIFQKFCANQSYPIAKLVKFRPTFCNFFPGPYCAEKILTSTFLCCLHPGKEARPYKKDTGKKSQDVLFSENRFCSL